MTSGIYKIKNIVNNHTYVGSAVNIEQRWRSHKSYLNNNKHHSVYLQRAWNKYGADCFEFSVIELCFPFFLIAREQSWINKINPEYNISPTAGSSLGVKLSEETRSKLSAAHKGKTSHNLGKKMSLDQRAKLSVAHKGKIPHNLGKKASEETRSKISKAGLGRKASPETRAKLSAAQKGRKDSPETRAKKSLARSLFWAKRKEKNAKKLVM
jgi:group I intron endonuclease